MECKQNKHVKRHVISRYIDKTKQENSHVKLKIEKDSERRFRKIEATAKQIYKLRKMLELFQEEKITKSELESCIRINEISLRVATELAKATGKNMYEFLVIENTRDMFEELNIEEAKLCAILIKKEEHMQLIQQKIDTRWVETLKARTINKQKQ